jgi:glycosyltransferase involved in cell wall biosynthesis
MNKITFGKMNQKKIGMADVGVLIPAYNPSESLLSLIESLIRLDFNHIVVVNDGSDSECRCFFHKLGKMENCQILHHAVNLGKGRALKTGFNYFYLNFPELLGIVSADADGQHLPDDILKVSETFLKNGDKLVVGVRKFAKGTPLRSLIGNTITRHVFRFLVGKKLADTQSGLRCIPMAIIPDLIRLDGERYEYEMNMLISTRTTHTDIMEEAITTVYLDNNSSSNFNPVIDSMKIYFLLIRFASSSLLASLLDFVVFTVSYNLSLNIPLSIFIGRYTVGPMVNFGVNKSFVFHHKGNISRPLIKYYLSATMMGIVASLLIGVISNRFSISVILSKILVETCLFIVSFTIQRDYIFISRSEGEK